MTDTPKTYKILLLDDDQFLIDMYSLKFNQGGHTVQSCFSVDEALKVLSGGFAADAIVFDLVMPGKDGFDLLRAIKDGKLAQGATLIALTNQNAAEENKDKMNKDEAEQLLRMVDDRDKKIRERLQKSQSKSPKRQKDW